jgi:hypothetical protein
MTHTATFKNKMKKKELKNPTLTEQLHTSTKQWVGTDTSV